MHTVYLCFAICDDHIMSKFTHFGFEEVPWADKAKKVEAVFSNVSQNYDIMNDLMSLGIHRIWKTHFVRKVGAREGQTILDLAGGTGDIAVELCKKIHDKGQVILSDINLAMLEAGRRRILDKQFFTSLKFMQIDAESIPLPTNSLDRITMSFGLRNVTDKPKALAEMYRTLKPGGSCFILEFSKPTSPLIEKIYDTYSFSVIPFLGELIARDRTSYEYLVQSIRMHPCQKTLKDIMTQAGFDEVRYENLSGGIVAIHQGIKY